MGDPDGVSWQNPVFPYYDCGRSQNTGCPGRIRSTVYFLYALCFHVRFADGRVGVAMSALMPLFVAGVKMAYAPGSSNCKNQHSNYWWRWIYVLGGIYVLFDLFAIAVGLDFWNKLLLWMFDVKSSYWNMVWSFFIFLGGFVFTLGVYLLSQRKR